jgi:hypothetical protein
MKVIYKSLNGLDVQLQVGHDSHEEGEGEGVYDWEQTSGFEILSGHGQQNSQLR